jgi:predicted nucleotidyltransferase
MAKRKLPRDKIADFCKRNRIRQLSLFGSALKGKLRKNSDIDFLVEFRADEAPSLFDLARMERDLSKLLGGRKVDLRTPNELSRYFREEVLSTASVQYAKGRPRTLAAHVGRVKAPRERIALHC